MAARPGRTDAGLLNGWTAAGNRPTFELVTGISTGALSAPYAFLGPAYDAKLRELYTTIRTKDVLAERGVLRGSSGNRSPTRSAPATGRAAYSAPTSWPPSPKNTVGGGCLLIGTTNLDAQRAVVWNMGAIAAIGDSRALQLFHDILIASASIPGAFPPVMIDVDVDGRRYQEMHVDGGTVMQVFAYPPSLRLESDRPRHLYVVRNGHLDAQWANVERTTLSIAARAIDSLITTQGLGDLYRIYLTSKRDQVDYSLASIPSSFTQKPRELFDPAYMSALFDVGYSQALSGSAWTDHPPGFGPPTTTKP